jgi:hypothetical protein
LALWPQQLAVELAAAEEDISLQAVCYHIGMATSRHPGNVLLYFAHRLYDNNHSQLPALRLPRRLPLVADRVVFPEEGMVLRA